MENKIVLCRINTKCGKWKRLNDKPSSSYCKSIRKI